MSDPPVATTVPWEFRPGQLLPIPSVVLGALVVLALLVVFFLFHWLLGIPISSAQELLTPTARNSLYTVLLLGYAFGALRFGALGIEADLLRADPSGGWKYGWFPVEIVRRSRWVGGASVVAGVVLINVVAKMQGR